MLPDKTRPAHPIELDPDDFRALGHRLVDRLSDFLAEIRNVPVTRGESPEDIRRILKNDQLPEEGMPAKQILESIEHVLLDHSLFNGHPKFWGYITSSPAPLGVLGDFLSSFINSNVGSFQLSPVATEIEAQTIRWIADFIGYPRDCGGILVSGGNMANFVGFLAGRKAKAPWDLRKEGIQHLSQRRVRIYASPQTHTWLQKAADMFGFGTDALRWISVDEKLRMDVDKLRAQINSDRIHGDLPLMVVGSAGTVGTGAVDPLNAIAEICSESGLWFHVDGAYGGFAAGLPDASDDLKALRRADSVAVDPHKWLYAPLEAGCALVKEKEILRDAFSYHVPYYRFDDKRGEPPTNYFEFGPQNSRGFRALKIWLTLQQIGRRGYREQIARDCDVSRHMYSCIKRCPELEALTQELSIVTFRYVPREIDRAQQANDRYLNELNGELLTQLQQSGEAFLSNAVVGEKFVLRACIVNFRTTRDDAEKLPDIILRFGRNIHQTMKKSRV